MSWPTTLGVRDLTIFDAVSGGAWERGLFALMRNHSEVFEQLPGCGHEALVAAHLRNATHVGFRPGVLETFMRPWQGADGQAAYYRQYRQLAQAERRPTSTGPRCTRPPRPASR